MNLQLIRNSIPAYIKLLEKLAAEGASKVQFDEPYLIRDLGSSDIALFEEIYKNIFKNKVD